MKFEISDDFLEFIKGLSGETSAETVVDLLQWASQNKQAKEVVDGFRRLNTVAKREFCFYLLRYKYTPEQALNAAKNFQEQNRKDRSLISKIVARVQEGYPFTMPNGVQCVIRRDKQSYALEFTVQGIKVTVVYLSLKLKHAMESLQANCVPTYRLYKIIIDNQTFLGTSGQINKKIVEAITKNVSPYLYALLGEEEQ
jgi:hypothetical protein